MHQAHEDSIAFYKEEIYSRVGYDSVEILRTRFSEQLEGLSAAHRPFWRKAAKLVQEISVQPY